MSMIITRTKIIPPRHMSELLYRQRLIDLLYDLMERRLIIVTAPAGYGKTSLLMSFIKELELPICWLSLDSLDRDFYRFVYYFIAAMEERFPNVAKQVRRVAESSPKLEVERLVTALVNASLNIAGHFVIILDDYHLISDVEKINYFISRIVEQCGDNLHLVLTTRTLPALPDFPLMVARRWVDGLSFDELAFRPNEVQELMLKNHNLRISREDAQELINNTEGWITGLLMSAQTVGKAMTHQIRLARGSGTNLYDYLAQQVLDQQPPELRHFLLHSSVMEEFDAKMCYELLGEPTGEQNWYDLIEFIQQSNLFVSSVGDDNNQWVRYHTLFRDFLQARLERENRKEYKRLRRHLAQWFTEQEKWEKAHKIYHELKDHEADAQVIEQAGSELLKSGRVETLEEWIRSLPNKLRNKRPGILSLRGVIFTEQSQITQGLFLLNQTITICRITSNQSLLARTLVRRAVAYRMRGEYEATLTDVDEIFTIAQEAGLQFDYAEALRLKGMSLYYIGQTQDAISSLTDSLLRYELLDEEQHIAVLCLELGLVKMEVGEYSKALSYYRRALAYWEIIENSAWMANLLNNLAVLHYLQGDYETALITLERAMIQARKGNSTRIEAYILCSIGDLYTNIRTFTAAYEAYRQSRQKAEQSNERLLSFYVLLAEVNLMQAQSHLSEAYDLLRQASSLFQESGSSLEEAFIHLANGRLALYERDYSQAISDFKQAACDLEKAQQYPEAARTQLYLAVAYGNHKQKNLAEVHLERAFQSAARLDSEHTLLIAGYDLERELAKWSAWPQVKNLLSKIDDFKHSLPMTLRKLRQHAQTIPLDPPPLSIRALGEMRAVLEGEEVAWGWAKVRDFFFCLLMNPRGLSKEEIGERLWPEKSAKTINSRFKEVRKEVRKVISSESVIFDGTRYLFNKTLDYDYDVELFLAELKKTDSLTSTIEKIEAYQRATSHYRGKFLPFMEEQWVVAERERLHQLYIDAMIQLATLYLEQGELQDALQSGETLLSLDPAQEEAHRITMRVYAQRGNHAEVVRQFEKCEEALDKELGVPVSEQTKTLYYSLVR